MTQIEGCDGQEGRDEETYAVIGAAMEVHRTLGPGFLEPVYQAALAVELGARGIPYVREAEVPIHYKQTSLGVRYRADFICFGGVLLELKAVSRLTTIEDAQLINYLLATKLSRGLLLNFGASSLQFRRFIGSDSRSLSPSVRSVKSVDPVARKP